jgi:hypothetical protein
VKRLLPWLPLCALWSIALCELGAHVHARSQVATLADWQRAAAVVRREHAPRDLIRATPDYADPVLRQVLSDLIDLPMAGRSHAEGYERLWVLSPVAGQAEVAPEARGRRVELEQRFGKIVLRRYALGPSAVLVDLTRRVPEACVTSRGAACPWRTQRPARGGGLGLGVLAPVERFVCAGGSWVAAVVQEDLSIRPRHCVRQAVRRGRPVQVTLPPVPLGKRLVLYGGLYYEDERMRRGAPVDVRVLVDDRELGRLRHHDGDGWKRSAWRVPGAMGAVTIDVRSDSERERSYCWAASTRSTDRDRAP